MTNFEEKVLEYTITSELFDHYNHSQVLFSDDYIKPYLILKNEIHLIKSISISFHISFITNIY